MPEIDGQDYDRHIAYLYSSRRTLVRSFEGPMHRECHRLAPIGRTTILAKGLDEQVADILRRGLNR